MAEITSHSPDLGPLTRELDRTVDRLRTRSILRLGRAWDPAQPHGPSAALVGLGLAQRLVDAAAAVEHMPTHALPDVEPHVVPDVLAVCGGDLLAALVAAHAGGDRTQDLQQRADWAVAELRRFRSVL